MYIVYIMWLSRGYIGIMEKKMETTIVYWGYVRVILCTYLRMHLRSGMLLRSCWGSMYLDVVTHMNAREVGACKA